MDGDGESMLLLRNLLALIILVIFFGSDCYPATITGTVKGPDGAPFEGAFVQAQNTKTRMAFIVLTDSQGRYRVEKVPAGEYQLTSRATGFRGDPRPGVTLTADQDASFEFALQKAAIRWNELSIYQAKQLLPASTGKETLFAQCFVCHGFQTRMASVRRDADGWQDRVQFMRDSMHFSLSWRFDDKKAADVASFLNSSFGTDATVPRSPADLPEYKNTT